MPPGGKGAPPEEWNVPAGCSRELLLKLTAINGILGNERYSKEFLRQWVHHKTVAFERFFDLGFMLTEEVLQNRRSSMFGGSVLWDVQRHFMVLLCQT